MHAPALGVDRHDNRLAAECARKLADERRARKRGGVDADLVRPRLEHRRRVVERPNAATDGERDRDVLRDARCYLDSGPARLDRRCNVEKHELVRASVRVRGAELDGIADVAQPAEADALDDAPARDVEAGDQPRERHCSRNLAPAAPLFSGWNCTPRKAPDSMIAA